MKRPVEGNWQAGVDSRFNIQYEQLTMLTPDGMEAQLIWYPQFKLLSRFDTYYLEDIHFPTHKVKRSIFPQFDTDGNPEALVYQIRDWAADTNCKLTASLKKGIMDDNKEKKSTLHIKAGPPYCLKILVIV